MPDSRLILTTIKGNSQQCGEAYGEEFSQRLLGFFHQEFKPNRRTLQFATRCLKYVEKYAPHSAQFLAGMSRSAQPLMIEHLMMLSLHEEIGHDTHCTALVATKDITRENATFVGQNWDWKPSRFPWPGLLHLKIKGAPELLTYHYPGLWSCLGINECGLSLMWTGGGYYPRVKSIDGVPTYIVIAEILRLKTVDEAVSYLKKIRHAGCFLFFIADAKGQAVIVEGIPGKIAVEKISTYGSRANHYESPEIIKSCRQYMPTSKLSTTKQRKIRIQEHLDRVPKKLSATGARLILTDKTWLHRWGLNSMTIDSFVAVCENRTLSVARGGSKVGPWHTYSL